MFNGDFTTGALVSLESNAASRPLADGSADPLGHPAVLVENAGGRGAAIIVCDHASNHIPARFGRLGLSDGELQRHIAWDPGALGVSRRLARLLDAPLIGSTVSRLVIDCNRDPSAIDAIPAASEATVIPGNADLAAGDRAWRIAEVYGPFHAAVDQLVSGKAREGGVAVIAIHTFTPVYNGVSRPWHVGVLFDRDRRLPDRFLASLRGETGLVVGENQPYSPNDRVYHTLDRHAQSRGLPNVMIEIRNDLVATPEAEEAWGDRLARALA